MEFIRIVGYKQIHTKKEQINAFVRTMEENYNGGQTWPPASVSASFERQSHETMFLIVSLMTQLFYTDSEISWGLNTCSEKTGF